MLVTILNDKSHFNSGDINLVILIMKKKIDLNLYKRKIKRYIGIIK